MNVTPTKLDRDVAELQARLGNDPHGMTERQLLIHAITLNTRALLRLGDAVDQIADATDSIADSLTPSEVYDVLAP